VFFTKIDVIVITTSNLDVFYKKIFYFLGFLAKF